MRRLVVGLISGAVLLGPLAVGVVPSSAGGFSPAPGSPFFAGNGPISVAVGDFNGDGKLDVVVANNYTANVSVLLGDGHGGLSPAPGSPFLTGGFHPTSVASGDFNGDGKLDVAVVNEGGFSVSVLLGDGHGGLSPAPGSPFPSGGFDPLALATGDFNADGKLDVAVANNGSDDVSVLLGDGHGGLSPAPGSPFASGGNAISAAAGDFNGDGNLDVGVANFSNSASVLLGDGHGRLVLAPGSPFDTHCFGVFSIAGGDFNGDGRIDAALASFAICQNSVGTTSVLLTDNRGTLSPAPGSPYDDGGSFELSVAVGDFNADGKPDLAVANEDTSNVSVLLDNLPGAPSTLALSPRSAADPVRGQHTVRAAVKDASGEAVPGVTVRFSVTGANAASGSQQTDQNGQASFTYMGTNEGEDHIIVFADTNDNGAQDRGEPGDSATKVWFTPIARGAFVVGDHNAQVGNAVTFWGAQWGKQNSLSGGPAPASFKGFADATSTNPPSCAQGWTSAGGRSPPVRVPQFMPVIVSSSITKSGSTIAGDTPEVVVVKANPGYAPDPGHAGTGTVVVEVCHN